MSDTLVLAAWLAFLFVVLPIAVGWLIARQRLAYVAWVALVAVMAWSQSRVDDLSGLWIGVALLGGLVLPLVFVGMRLRAGETLRTIARTPARVVLCLEPAQRDEAGAQSRQESQ